MKNYFFCIYLLIGFLGISCGETPSEDKDTNLTADQEKTRNSPATVDFHPKAAELFESYTALEKEKLDFSSFENEENAKAFYVELEEHIDNIFGAVQTQMKDREQYLKKMTENEGFSMQTALDFSELKANDRIQNISILVGAYLNPEDDINTKSNSQATAIQHVVYRWAATAPIDSLVCLGSVKNGHKKEKGKYLRITKLDPTVATVHQIYPDGFHVEVQMNYEKPS